MEFYSVVLRKSINIPDSRVRIKTKSGRRIAYGTYEANGKTYTATRIVKGA